jgi:steroid delta-isomerase-like uncharacterized protein
MSTEQNKNVLRRIYDEVFNKGDFPKISELVAPNFIEHEHVPGTKAAGGDTLREFTSMMRSAFPDARFTADDMIAEGDKVAARFTMQGTHKGEFMGMSPTGKKVTMTGIDFVRIVDNKIVEHWGSTDMMGLMQQLGMMPEMAQEKR